jgi:hypothetical protein
MLQVETGAAGVGGEEQAAVGILQKSFDVG